MSVPRIYSKAVHEDMGWWGTFPPDLPLRVGDVVQLDNEGRMSRIKSVLDMPGWREAMPVHSDQVDSGVRRSRHAAKRRVATAQAAVTANIAGAQGAVEVSFSEAGGFVLEYSAGWYHKFRDVDQARRTVETLASTGQWEKDWVLITEVVEANPATVVVSSAQEARTLLSAQGELPVDITGVNLSDPRLGFASTTESKDVFQSVSTRTIPLYHCARMKRRWYEFRAHARLEGAENQTEAVTIDSPFEEDDV